MESRVRDTILKETSDGRGRGLYIVNNKRAGDVLVSEKSPALWISKSSCMTDCAYCCKHSDDSQPYGISCLTCNRVTYCSTSCQECDRQQHEFVCPFLRKSAELGLEEDEDSCVFLCASVKFLAQNQPEEFLKVMSQDDGSTVLLPEEESACNKAFEVFEAVEPSLVTKKYVIDLYKKDKSCGFAIMKPPHLRLQPSLDDDDDDEEPDTTINGKKKDDSKASDDTDAVGKPKASDDSKAKNEEGNDKEEDDGDDDNWEDLDTESVVKGFGVYPYLSLINHSCLPNCIRWDLVDAPASSSVTAQDRRAIHFRALHAIPEGAELLHSYTPVCWSLEERQEYLSDMFGFTCRCDRCITEAVIEGIKGKKGTTSKGSLSSGDKKIYKQRYAYIQLFLEKHVCGENGCSGTLTPVLGFDETVPGLDQYECNVCMRKRSHADFVATVKSMR